MNTKKLLLIALLSFFISNCYSQSLNDSLLIYYPFNGNANDSSENHFNGITNAKFTNDRFGNPNSALYFNGFDMYLDFPPNQPKLKPKLPVSFSFWVNMEDYSPENNTFFTTDFAQNNHTGVWMCLSSFGEISINYGDGSGNTSYFNRRTKVGKKSLFNTKWTHIVGIVKGPIDMEIYVNGVNIGGSYSGEGDELKYTDCQGSIGRKDAGVLNKPYYFKGTIDEFRYWNRALTEAEILALSNYHKNAINNQVQSKNKVNFFPNPCFNYININNIPENSVRIEILNSKGNLIKTISIKEKINIKNLNSGIYSLRIINNENKITNSIKFIKK